MPVPTFRALVAAALALLLVAPLAPAGAQVDPTVPPDPAAGPDEPADAYDSVIDLTFPVDPKLVRYVDDYHHGRSGGRRHLATDLMGPKLTPIYAAVGGVVLRRQEVDDVHGYRLTIQGDDGRIYSYVHLNNDTPGTDDGLGTPEQAYAAGTERGSRVERGQHIAYMGDSGNAEDTAPHLHFSIADPRVVDPYGTQVRNPYPSLRDAETRGDVPTAPAAPVPDAPPPPTPPDPPDVTGACAARMSASASAAPARSFSDVSAANVHHAAVGCLAALGVTLGVGGDRYDPSGSVTRLQMASFTTRLLAAGGVALPADPPNAFDDDDGSVHELAVNQLVELGVIRRDTGEEGRSFSGSISIWRDRMAVWMVRAHALIAGAELPHPGVDYFRDDGDRHHDEINRLAGAGIVQGTEPGRYSPRQPVRRDQMASYLTRVLASAGDPR